MSLLMAMPEVPAAPDVDNLLPPTIEALDDEAFEVEGLGGAKEDLRLPPLPRMDLLPAPGFFSVTLIRSRTSVGMRITLSLTPLPLLPEMLLPDSSSSSSVSRVS